MYFNNQHSAYYCHGQSETCFLWLLVCFSSFSFSRQIYRIFIVSVFSLTWLKKISVLLIISFLLMLMGSLKRFWRFLKEIFLRDRSPVYFLCSVVVPVSVDGNINGSSINIFEKNFNFVTPWRSVWLLHNFIQQSLNSGSAQVQILLNGVSEIRDGEYLWQCSRLEIRLNAFRRSTIS